MSKYNDFYDYVNDKVNIIAKSKGLTLEHIASYLNLSESFIKKVSSHKNNSHYNLYHIWKLSNMLETPIEEMLPPINNYDDFLRVRPLSSFDDYKKFINKISENGDMYNE
ncbi:hypothetical protein RZ70_05300 [Apilactobacillus kunkeei]|uniref:hypothetical protein n=1 Tax=Apilactobacillus kunkeei TaxID=148814 RepID=UPI0006C4E048|nr:hypothetical protein [Apilactobacillus kunkeei]KOY76035.1 hypothetical protein RZ70_05300 [Apilactobacillus kunkeei]